MPGPSSFDAVLCGWQRTPTLPYEIGDRDGAVANTSAGRGNGSRLYELNLWMWRYGRGHPRKVSVGDAEFRRRERAAGQRQRAAATMKRRREERGDDYYARRADEGQHAEEEAADD